jgi:geranylgeranyl pyrophosphate synthase
MAPGVPRPARPVQANIPASLRERRRLLHETRQYVARTSPVPPLPLKELQVHADCILQQAGVDSIFRDYVALLVNNETWREQLAGVPFERRLLLLPKCLRDEERCPAGFDELGLLCENCGLCPIQDLSAQAEKLGYAVLVAEGSAVVMNMIKTGQIEAVIGVSCMNVLKRAFPHMEAAAVPGIAIPLLQDDCANTSVDLDWVWDYMHVTADERARRLDLGRLRREASACFEAPVLDRLLGAASGPTETLARDWLARTGKRWRPFLTLAASEALRGGAGGVNDDLRALAVAVECFHKASLVHDDIEDNDATRYGERTLHEEHGVAVALNVGDFLIGEGYRLLGLCPVSDEARGGMLRVASAGQRELCRGQGAELLWTRERRILSVAEVLDIFRQKTAPAFEVALRLGAIHAGQAPGHLDVLGEYSRALGVAYQIRDDLADFGVGREGDDIAGRRPSLILALAREKASGVDRELLDNIWLGRSRPAPGDVEAVCRRLGADEEAERLLASFKESAVRALAALDNADLKGLLRRVVGRIFNEIEFQGWCSEHRDSDVPNAADVSSGAGL